MSTNPNTRRILCCGGSYTWGYQPQTNHLRFPADTRGCGVLQKFGGRKSQFRNTTPKLLVVTPPIIYEAALYAKER